MTLHLLLVAGALAAPDTGDPHCDGAVPFEGTWTGDGCLVTPEPSEVCDHVFRLPACETWDAMVAHTLDPEFTGSWRGWLGTCPDGGHVVTGLTTLPESSTTLYFEPGGDIAGAVIWGGMWSDGCCEGNLTKILRYGLPFECDFPDPYVPPPEPVDPGPATVTPEPPAERGGCGCSHTGVGSPAWLFALGALARRRQAGSNDAGREASPPERREARSWRPASACDARAAGPSSAYRRDATGRIARRWGAPRR